MCFISRLSLVPATIFGGTCAATGALTSAGKIIAGVCNKNKATKNQHGFFVNAV